MRGVWCELFLTPLSMKRLLPAFTLIFGLVLSSTVSANKFSPTTERQYRQSSISMEQALKSSSIHAKNRRPGLGSYTRRVQNYRLNRTENRVNSTSTDRQIRATSGRVFGGRNGYARYLRSLETDNSNRVSRLRPGRVDSADTADTEANTR